MARDGYRIFDSDAHIWETAESIEQYIEPKYRDAALAAGRQPLAGSDYHIYAFARKTFNRRLGSNEPVARTGAQMRSRGTSPNPLGNVDPHLRIKDMDIEGIDVDMILASRVNCFCADPDPQLEMAVYRAYHRFMTDYCAPYPDRLVGALLVTGRDVEGSVQEMKRLAKERWPVSVLPVCPQEMPLDDPSLDPIWATAADLGFAVALHTYTWTPPYSPGADDQWDNAWLARAAAHPWCGMRNMAAFLGSGVMDKYPDLRLGCLEAGQGWLPFWLVRLDEQTAFLPGSLPPNPRPVSEYLQQRRYFQSIELHEGQRLTKTVIDFVGEGVLMFASDYPHGESWFPEAAQTMLGWDSFSEDLKRKLFWDNPTKFYRRYQSAN